MLHVSSGCVLDRADWRYRRLAYYRRCTSSAPGFRGLCSTPLGDIRGSPRNLTHLPAPRDGRTRCQSCDDEKELNEKLCCSASRSGPIRARRS